MHSLLYQSAEVWWSVLDSDRNFLLMHTPRNNGDGDGVGLSCCVFAIDLGGLDEVPSSLLGLVSQWIGELLGPNPLCLAYSV